MSTTGSISENRILLSMEPPVLDWIKFEARFFGLTVPATIRMKLREVWQELPPDWKERLNK